MPNCIHLCSVMMRQWEPSLLTLKTISNEAIQDGIFIFSTSAKLDLTVRGNYR